MRRGLLLAAVLLSGVAVTGVATDLLDGPTANAALTNVWPASGDGEIYPDLTTTDALFAYVTSDFRGGRICIIPATGVGDCEVPAWGSPNVVVGVGTIFTLIEGPRLKEGTWRLLTESPRPAGVDGWDRQAVSDVFTVMACEDAGTCESTVGAEEAEAFKEASRGVGLFTEGACKGLQALATASQVKSGVDALGSGNPITQGAFIASYGAGLGLGAIGMIDVSSYNDAAKKILMMFSCEVARMYEDIANDPPDPNAATVQQPVLFNAAPTGDPATDALIKAFDREQAYGKAARIAYERYQGAIAFGDPAGAQRQLDALGTFSGQLTTSMRETVEALRVAAASTEAAVEGVPIETITELDELRLMGQRVTSSGFAPSEVALLRGLGLSDAEISGARTWFEFDSPHLAVGRTMDELLIALADETERAVVDVDAFARTIANVRVPQPPNALPLASFTLNPTSGEAPLSVTLDASASIDPDGALVGYAWDFGDGHQGTGRTTAHTYTGAGTYVVRLTVTDDRGGSVSSTRTVNVAGVPPNVSPVAAFDATGSTSNPLSFTFRSTSFDADGTLTSQSWDFGDGSTANGAVVAHTFALGSYTVTLTVTDDDGASSSSMGQITLVAGNAPPIPSAQATTGSPGPLDVAFDASGSTDADGAIASYLWDFGDGTAPSTEVAPLHTYAASGTYAVQLTVADDDGATAIAVGTVALHLPPIADIEVDHAEGSAPLTVRFDGSASTAPDGAIVSYAWEFGDSSTATGPVVEHTYLDAQQYSATLTVTDSNGLQAIAVATITATPNGPPNAFDLQMRGTGGVGFDILEHVDDPNGDPVSLQSTGTPAHGTVACRGLGACLYTADPGFVGEDNFTYTVTDGIDSATGTVTVLLNAPPPPSVPTAVDDLAVTVEGIAVDVDALANDSGDTIAIVSIGSATNGDAQCSPDGACRYSPNAGFTGDDSFTYTIQDRFGQESTARVHVIVAPMAQHNPVVDGQSWPPTAPSSTVLSGGQGRWTVGAKVTPSGAGDAAGLDRQIDISLGGDHVLVADSVDAAPGWTVTPSAGGLDVRADADALLGESVLHALPAPGSPVSQGTGGDGHVPILVGSRMYAFFHHTDPVSITCIDRANGRLCPGYPIPLNVGTGNIPGPGAVFGSKIYVHIDPFSTANMLYCFDTATDRPCAPVITERSGTGAGSAPVAVGGSMWSASATGRLHCVIGASGEPCAISSVATGLAPDPTDVWDIVTHGGRVYVSNSLGAVACIESSTAQPCSGWELPHQFPIEGNLVNRHDATGAVTGVCLVTNATSMCVGDGGGQLSTHAAWPFSDGYYNEQQEAETGTRTFYGSLNRGGLGCWDWTTMAVCEGSAFVDGWVDRDVDGTPLPSAYGATFDGQCIVALGDPGLAFTLAPSGSSPCSGIGAGASDRMEPVDLREQRCDGTVGSARWRDVRLLGADLQPGSELTSLVVVVRDAESGEQLASRELIGTAGTIDLASVDPASHPSLTLEVTAVSVAGNPAWTDGSPPRVEVRWFSDPAAVCFLTDTLLDCNADETIVITAEVGGLSLSRSLDVAPPPACTPQNTAPQALPQTVVGEPATPLPITLGGTDLDGDRLTFAIDVQPVHGTLTTAAGAAPGSVLYIPDAGYVGTDAFAFTAFDGWARSSPATVTVTLVPSSTTTTTVLPTTTTTELPTTTTSTTTTTVLPSTTTTEVPTTTTTVLPTTTTSTTTTVLPTTTSTTTTEVPTTTSTTTTEVPTTTTTTTTTEVPTTTTTEVPTTTTTVLPTTTTTTTTTVLPTTTTVLPTTTTTTTTTVLPTTTTSSTTTTVLPTTTTEVPTTTTTTQPRSASATSTTLVAVQPRAGEPTTSTASPGPTLLPTTGSDSDGAMRIVALLVATGAGLLAAARRRAS